MQKSIFTKYFTVCASLIIVTITILGVFFMVFVSQYFKEDKYRLLQSNAERAVLVAQQDFNEKGWFDLEALRIIYRAMGQSTDADFILTNVNGGTILATNMQTDKIPVVPKTAINQLRKSGSYFEMGKLGTVYSDHYYTVASPIKIEDKVVGYIFTSTHASKQLQSFLNQMLKLFLFSSIAVLILAFIIVYFVSLQMVKPLRQMSEAAKKFGDGEFSTRLEISSYDEMGQLATSLNDMAKSLSTLETMRRSFTANISHELKTPMTSIAGFIDGILDGTIPPEKEKHYLRIVSDETKRLSRLVKSMLNLSRIEAGEMQINTSKINIVDTICQGVFSFEQQIEKKNIAIRGLDRSKVIVEADPDLIHQVTYNLIENAVKFVDDGGYIEFNFNEEDTRTLISVKNSGTGLSQEELPKIFERFYKTDKSRGLDKNGVGLGLYIVRSIVKLHGGDIAVKSVEGEYVEFIFSINSPNKQHNSVTHNVFKKS